MYHKVAYILHLFPTGHISLVNELMTLKDAQIDVHIVAIRRANSSDVMRVPYEPNFPVTYLLDSCGTFDWSSLAKDNLHFMYRHPLTYSCTAALASRWRGRNFKLAASFGRILEAIKPTLVYVNWSWHYCGSVMYACRILGLPFIFSVRGTDIVQPARNFSLRVNTAERILTPSPKYVEILKTELNVPANKIRLVPNCLGSSRTFERVKPARDKITGPLRLLYVATVRPVKRHEDLIRSCAILRKQGINIECRIFGEWSVDSYLKDLQDLIAQLGLTDQVTLAGLVPQENLPKEFEWSDIYVHTSEREGFGNAIVEAQASARPVVVADGVGGMRDSVIPGETATMVPVGQPKELAKAIVELMNDPARRLRMGSAGRGYVIKHFSYEHFGPRFLKALLGEENDHRSSLHSF